MNLTLLATALTLSQKPLVERQLFAQRVNSQYASWRTHIGAPEGEECSSLGLIINSGEFEDLKKSDGYNANLAQVERWVDKGGAIFLIGEPTYPATLEQIPDPPLVLFVLGALPTMLYLAPAPRAVAIVGSRSSNTERCNLATEVASGYAAREVVVVSGLALGIDTAAHRGALSSGIPGSTVAVLGNGLSKIYPPRNEQLAREIIESGGAIVSQFAPETPPYPANFLDRNRIIAGLSAATIVVQAALRSGALSTARHAAEQGREVYAIPGDIRDQLSAGTNRLLRDGASPWLEHSDLDHLYPPILRDSKKSECENENESGSSAIERSILAALKESPRGSTQLATELPTISPGQLQLALLELELKRKIRKIPGNLYEPTPTT